jgi:hypothetical protein
MEPVITESDLKIMIDNVLLTTSANSSGLLSSPLIAGNPQSLNALISSHQEMGIAPALNNRGINGTLAALIIGHYMIDKFSDRMAMSAHLRSSVLKIKADICELLG